MVQTRSMKKLRLRRRRTSIIENSLPANIAPATNGDENGNVGRKRLLKYEELESWQKEDNHFIEKGYRPASGSFKKCIRSLIYIHNETINIYSHIIGSILFVALPIYIFNTEIPPRYRIATKADIAVCCIYFSGVAVCFLLSAFFHTITNHSSSISKIGVKLDFQGIVLLIWGVGIPLIYYGFYCDRKLQIVYWCLHTFLALSCSILTLQPHFYFSPSHSPSLSSTTTAVITIKNNLRPLRALLFASLATSTLIPIIHSIIKYGFSIQVKRLGLRYFLGTIVANAVGAGVYAFRLPERCIKRRFDIFGASHQWLHIMTVIAGLFYTFALLEAFDILHAGTFQCSA